MIILIISEINFSIFTLTTEVILFRETEISPMKEYYDSIKNRGYDGTVSFEICDRRYYRDPDKAIDDIVAWMKANTNEFD